MWLTSEPGFKAWLDDNGLFMLITSRQMDIYRRPAYCEHVTVQTSVYQIKGALGFRNTFILDEQGGIVAKSCSTGPFIDNTAGKLVRVPADVQATMNIEPKREMDELPRKIAVPDAPVEELPAIQAQRSDIDFYGHVNNANYVRMACDLLPEGFEWDRLRVEYKGQAKLGMHVHPTMRRTDGLVYMTLSGDEGETFVNLEFSKR